jgi:type I restriction enzyme, S subunit
MAKSENTKHFHNTEIPSGWEVMEFGEFAETEKGKYVPVANEDLRCLELEHFDQGTGHILGWVNSSEQKSTKNKFKKGQVLFGKLRPYLQKYWLAEYDGVCSSEVWVLNSKNKKCSNEFLFRLVQTNRFIQVANVSSGSKMPRADWDYVSAFPFSLPPLPEQKAIAHILSLMDTAINKNNLLIAKKELQKKWLMQNLLTGKKRLLNDELGIINDEWKTIKLGDVFEFLKTYSISREGLTKENLDELIYCIHYGDIHAFYETDYLDFSNQKNIPQIINASQSLNEKDYLKDGDVIMADASEDYQGVGEAVEVLNLKNKIAVGGLHTIVLRGNPKIIANGFRGYFFASEVVRNALRKVATGTSVYSVTKSQIHNLSFIIPNSLKEQTAIAQVLHSADIEIKLLKTRTDKLREKKKGLMQQLLTGKKRLKVV